VATGTKYRNYEVIIGKKKTLKNLIKLGEMEFDAILGIDWLSACGAHVDCEGKRIIFIMKGVPEFTFERVKDKCELSIISAMRATKLIRQECLGFLASVISMHEIETKIENIPVVISTLMCFLKICQDYPQIGK